MFDKEKLTPFAALCTCCAFIWQVVMVILVWAGKWDDDQWLIRPFQKAIDDANAVQDSLAASWKTDHFTDIVIANSNTECPITHPHQLFHEVWQGVQQTCDCSMRTGFL